MAKSEKISLLPSKRRIGGWAAIDSWSYINREERFILRMNVNSIEIFGDEMKTGSHKDDPFRAIIGNILVTGAAENSKGGFKSRVFAEVQSYSTELQEMEHASDLFFRLCELIVDCQSLSMPDDSFKIIVAYLLNESKGSQEQLDEQIRELLGMDSASFEAAKERFKEQQCILSSLNKAAR